MLKTFLLSCIALAMGALQNFGGTLPSDPRLYTALILGEKGIGSGCLLQSSNAIYLVTARHVLFGEASGTNSRPLISSFAVIKSHYTTDSNKLDSVD
ncbi:MAG TPA: hypothetical protein VHC44_12520, partial [Verrucomicrobiae bacterium]|nr:hypothetical protein [Verrucomicrobiae bacterium]